MNILEKYNLKLGDKIITNGNWRGTFEPKSLGWLIGEIIAIAPNEIYIGSNNETFNGASFPYKLPKKFRSKNYSKYKYTWKIAVDNKNCIIYKIKSFDKFYIANLFNLKQKYGN